MLRMPAAPTPSSFIEPCLPSPADHPPSGPDWIHEIKHDGYRFMVRRDSVGIRLLTRNGHDWSDRYPLIVEAANLLKDDGEAVACDDNERRKATLANLLRGCRPGPRLNEHLTRIPATLYSGMRARWGWKASTYGVRAAAPQAYRSVPFSSNRSTLTTSNRPWPVRRQH
jgi:hypothetical protein